MSSSSPAFDRPNATVLEELPTTLETRESADGSQAAAAHLLEVANLSKSFGELKAVDDVSFHVDGGEVFACSDPTVPASRPP